VKTLLNTPEAAEFLGISASTMAQWRMLNKGPSFVKLGTRVMYRQIDLEAWLEANLVHGEGCDNG